MCYDETKEVWQVSNVSRSLSLDKQKKHFWWLDANNWVDNLTEYNTRKRLKNWQFEH